MTFHAQLTAKRVVPVVVVKELAHTDTLAEALVQGGLPVAEVTFRTACAPDVIKQLAERGDILVGAGTVINTDQVDQAIDCGANFIVSPGVSRKVIERCIEKNIPIYPGAVTAAEVQVGLEYGLETLKFFPAEAAGGTKVIKALSGPFPQLKFMPTGGIGLNNLSEYLSLPMIDAIGGSWMVPANLVAEGNVDELVKLVKDAVAAAAAI